MTDPDRRLDRRIEERHSCYDRETCNPDCGGYLPWLTRLQELRKKDASADPYFGSVVFTSTKGAEVRLQLVARDGTSCLLPSRAKGRASVWKRIRIDGPAPIGRLYVDVPGKRLSFDVEKALSIGDTRYFEIAEYGGDAIRLGFNAACGVTTSGELVFGAPVLSTDALVAFRDATAPEYVEPVPLSPKEYGDVVRARLAEYEKAGLIIPENPSALAEQIRTGGSDWLRRLAKARGIDVSGASTAEELRAALLFELFPGSFANVPLPTKPVRLQEASKVYVQCSEPGCRRTTEYPLGTLDALEARCGHVFDFRAEYGVAGALVCRGCHLKIDSRQVLDVKELDVRMNTRANELADVSGRLRDENRALLVENANLRRRLEKAERKK